MVTNEQLNNCFLRIDSPDLGDGPDPKTIGSELFFTSMPPDVGSSKSANVSPVHILGRANPLWVYAYSDERSWNLELKFFSTVQTVRNIQDLGSLDDNTAGDINNTEVKEQVLDKVNWCESLVYPIYKDSLSRGIPKLTFVFGDMLNTSVICTDVQTSFPGPWYVKSANTVGFPMFAIVNMTLKHTGGRSYSHLDVRSNLHNGPQLNDRRLV